MTMLQLRLERRAQSYSWSTRARSPSEVGDMPDRESSAPTFRSVFVVHSRAYTHFAAVQKLLDRHPCGNIASQSRQRRCELCQGHCGIRACLFILARLPVY
jgi:hypothetical protein